MKKRMVTNGYECRTRNTQALLDGLIIYGQELGALGKQLERLLRQRGVRSSMDVVFVSRCH
jgi:hypothetical protein